MARLRALAVPATLCAALAAPAGASANAPNDAAANSPADGTCSFERHGRVLALVADCITTHSIVIPDGFTLDGRHHRITARDPEGGSFAGAIVRNGGREAHVWRLRLATDDLRVTCHPSSPEDTRLRGILFENASGSIRESHVESVAQRAFGCQEGMGIEVRALGPHTADAPEQVSITANRVEGFQKTGVLVLGSAQVGLCLNRITGAGERTDIAQNGVQISRGARADIKLNRIRGVAYAGADWSAVGVLVEDTAELSIAMNRVLDADVGIWLERASNVSVEANHVHGAREDAVVIDGSTGPATGNDVRRNSLSAEGVGVLLYGEGATRNSVLHNRIQPDDERAVVELEGAHGNTLPAP